MILILCISAYIYIYILAKNGLLFNKQSQKIESILNKSQSIYFEVFELMAIFCIIMLLYDEKQYILTLVFVLQFIEHINQIIFCYRQNSHDLHIITILLDVVFVLYAYYKECYWILPIFTYAICIHISSLYYNKAFTDVVCIFPVKN